MTCFILKYKTNELLKLFDTNNIYIFSYIKTYSFKQNKLKKRLVLYFFPKFCAFLNNCIKYIKKLKIIGSKKKFQLKFFVKQM